nr:hypothetical protein [Bacilli bacterium]
MKGFRVVAGTTLISLVLTTVFVAPSFAKSVAHPYNAVRATLVKNVNVSGTTMVEASDGTMYVETLQGNVVKLTADGGIEGIAQTGFLSNSGLQLSSDGQTLSASGKGQFGEFTMYLGSRSYQESIGTDTINTASMSVTNSIDRGLYDITSPDGNTGYSLDTFDSSGTVTEEAINNNGTSGSYSSSLLLNTGNNYDMQISPDDSTLYIDNNDDVLNYNIVEFNTVADTFQSENVVGGYEGMILSSDGSTLYLTNWGSHPKILTFSTASKSVTGNPITGYYLPKNDPADANSLDLGGSLLYASGNINGQQSVAVVNMSQKR